MPSKIDLSRKPKRSNGLRPDPGRLIQMPEATLRRNRKMRDACILYMYGDPETKRNSLSFVEISDLVGIRHSKEISRAALLDKWEEFRLELIAKSMRKNSSDPSNPLALYRSSDELKRIQQEIVRQVAELPALEAEAARVLDLLEGYKSIDSKEYQMLVNTLDKLTQMIEKRAGKDAFDKQNDEISKARIRLAEKAHDPELTRNPINDAKIIELAV